MRGAGARPSNAGILLRRALQKSAAVDSIHGPGIWRIPAHRPRPVPPAVAGEAANIAAK